MPLVIYGLRVDTRTDAYPHDSDYKKPATHRRAWPKKSISCHVDNKLLVTGSQDFLRQTQIIYTDEYEGTAM